VESLVLRHLPEKSQELVEAMVILNQQELDFAQELEGLD
jgi:hypothetical protein